MAMGKCSAYSSLQGDSKVKFAAWPTSWRPPGADRLWPRGTTVNSRIWLRAVDDSTINNRRGYHYYYFCPRYYKSRGLKTKLKTRTHAGTATFRPRGLCG